MMRTTTRAAASTSTPGPSGQRHTGEDAAGTVPVKGIAAGCGPLLAWPQERRPLRQRLFEHLRATGCASRVELARECNVAPASVTAVVGELIGLGLVEETTLPRDPSRGRPPVALTVARGAYAVAGIKLSSEAHTAVILDFAGEVIAEASMPARQERRSLTELSDEMAVLLADVLAAAGMEMDALAGVGLGLPGLVAHHRGRVMWSPLLNEREIDIEAHFAARFGLPVSVDNDANLLALAELWFGTERAMTDFVLVTVEHGVGMGLVINNRLFRGASELGMEIGHTKVALDGALCRCGRRGCLEAYVADYALVREARIALKTNLDDKKNVRTLLRELFAEAEAGNAAAQSIFSRAGRHLAMALANIVLLFDPSLIILSGEQVRSETLYTDAVVEEMRNLTLGGEREPRVEVHTWSDMVWARGAAALALDALTDRLVGESRPQ